MSSPKWIDPDSDKTDSYKDQLDRIAFTVNDDGSFTRTLYGVGKSPVPGHEPEKGS